MLVIDYSHQMMNNKPSILFAIFTEITPKTRQWFKYIGITYGSITIVKSHKTSYVTKPVNLMRIGCVDTFDALSSEILHGCHLTGFDHDSLATTIHEHAQNICKYRNNSGMINMHILTPIGTHLNFYIHFIRTSLPNINMLIDNRLDDYRTLMDQYIYPNIAVAKDGSTMTDPGFELFA